jgi:uncharacterized protein (TIGR03032 family)
MNESTLNALWEHHHALWRQQEQVIGLWSQAQPLSPDAVKGHVYGAWWEVLDAAGVTLIVGREYEHFLLAMTVINGQPHVTSMQLPHPSGLVYDAARNALFVACTRNPNQVIELRPQQGQLDRIDIVPPEMPGHVLLPFKSSYYPGCLYLHDLALIEGRLYANAVGQNAIVQLADDGRYPIEWFPKCIVLNNTPVFSQNHIQLNSIAAGPTIEDSFFSASADEITELRPGHTDYPVDKRGVIFDGRTREPLVRGLTRPHSARLHEQQIWVDNSGYGELGRVSGGQYEVAARLPGWTRGLTFVDQVAFVGTSRVIPRFRQYAPGLDVETSQCGVHAVDVTTGRVLGGITWEQGNQIFALETIPRHITSGFPFHPQQQQAQLDALFYSYSL